MACRTWVQRRASSALRAATRPLDLGRYPGYSPACWIAGTTRHCAPGTSCRGSGCTAGCHARILLPRMDHREAARAPYQSGPLARVHSESPPPGSIQPPTSRVDPGRRTGRGGLLQDRPGLIRLTRRPSSLPHAGVLTGPIQHHRTRMRGPAEPDRQRGRGPGTRATRPRCPLD